MGVYLIVNFPSNYILDKWGCRWGVRISVFCNLSIDFDRNHADIHRDVD